MGEPYKYTDEVMDHLQELFTLHMGELGLNYVGYGQEEMAAGYPAIMVTNAPKDRELHATGPTLLITFRIDLWVLHGNMNVGHAQRTKEDIQLANAITDLLDANSTLPSNANPEGNIIFGYVTSETPGIMTRSGRSVAHQVVATRLQWEGTSTQVM